MTTATYLLQQMIAVYKSWLPDSGEAETDLRATIRCLRQAGKPRIIKPTVPPVVESWLECCCAQPSLLDHQNLIQTLLEMKDRLGWFAPAATYAGNTMSQNYAFVRLIGPQLFGKDNAPFYSDTIAAGFTIQAPGVHYPPHWHPAIEFYGTLTGTGRWQIDDGPFEDKPPGTLIYHPANAPHAMQTSDQPTLNLYSWVGDILTRPVVAL